MVILALDTATDVTTVCLSVDGEATETATRARPHAAQGVLVDVAALLDRAGLAPDQVDRVLVGVGPGGYTGLRIGIATARGLAAALAVPVAGVSTLDALLAGDGVEVACIDARRGEVFAAGAGIAPCVLSPESLAGMVAGRVVAGDGAVRHRRTLAAASIPPDDSPLHVPWARHHVALAASAGPAEPCYLRTPDADRSIVPGAA
ncbi:MAG TPA: tRNA (adenosine(37)-N6)-threonylcarbamoyltransferase complex dimerization subunit type 1 TsaB [Gaiellales bacterium]|nr:tRNA (adenosine(37)-N6)-threonylcarbamoyltransferase complex dimerization subunit type 1 TsaB [Gaiellales bacterium]